MDRKKKLNNSMFVFRIRIVYYYNIIYRHIIGHIFFERNFIHWTLFDESLYARISYNNYRGPTQYTYYNIILRYDDDDDG